MSQVRRHDLRSGSGVAVTDDTNTFKKSTQTVGRPPVTETNINEEYMKDPPNNQPYTPSTESQPPGKKEGAYEGEDGATAEGVLGEEVTYPQGRFRHETALGEAVNEDSVHPNTS